MVQNSTALLLMTILGKGQGHIRSKFVMAKAFMSTLWRRSPYSSFLSL